MADGYTINQIFDLPLSDGEDDIILGKRGTTLKEPSLVEVFANVEDVDVTMGVTIGSTDVLQAGSRATLQAVVGVMPSTRDDKVVSSIGRAGEKIIVSGANADAAAAAELRVIIFVTPINDVILQRAAREAVGRA